MSLLKAMRNQEYSNLDHFEEDEAEEDTLSFSNLQLGDGDNNSVQQTPRASSSSEEPFEFFNCLSPENSPNPQNVILNEYHKRDFKSASFRKSSKTCDDQYLNYEKDRYITKNRSISARMDLNYTSKSSGSKVQQVNITGLTSMSAKSRRRMFMFGPVKFKPEMELSSIKQRQGKRAPNTILSQAAGGGDTAVNGGGKAGKGDHSQWGVLKSLRSRSNLSAVLARSFGCFPMAGVDRLITVAN